MAIGQNGSEKINGIILNNNQLMVIILMVKRQVIGYFGIKMEKLNLKDNILMILRMAIGYIIMKKDGKCQKEIIRMIKKQDIGLKNSMKKVSELKQIIFNCFQIIYNDDITVLYNLLSMETTQVS